MRRYSDGGTFIGDAIHTYVPPAARIIALQAVSPHGLGGYGYVGPPRGRDSPRPTSEASWVRPAEKDAELGTGEQTGAFLLCFEYGSDRRNRSRGFMDARWSASWSGKMETICGAATPVSASRVDKGRR